jgi:hypothetical protein
MGKKRRNQVGGNSDQTDWSGERTLADVEAEELAAQEEARSAPAARKSFSSKRIWQ